MHPPLRVGRGSFSLHCGPCSFRPRSEHHGMSRFAFSTGLWSVALFCLSAAFSPSFLLLFFSLSCHARGLSSSHQYKRVWASLRVTASRFRAGSTVGASRDRLFSLFLSASCLFADCSQQRLSCHKTCAPCPGWPPLFSVFLRPDLGASARRTFRGFAATVCHAQRDVKSLCSTQHRLLWPGSVYICSCGLA